MPALRGPESEFMIEARRRFADARQGWDKIRQDYRRDVRMVWGDQWAEDIRTQRENANRPVLSFPVLHTFVDQVVNEARMDRSESQVKALGEGASMMVAKVYEGIFRHVQQVSQAEVAYDMAIKCAAGGGIGFYEITTDYCDDETADQEPRICRVLDPLTVYFDPMAKEADLSDAEYYFQRQLISRAEYKRRFGTQFDPSDFEDDQYRKDWAGIEEDTVWIAKYWYAKVKRVRKYFMEDGSHQLMEDGPKHKPPEGYRNWRWCDERTIYHTMIDGARELEDEMKWPIKWFGMIPVMGQEMIIDGERKLIGVTRFANDAQKLKNACGSGLAESAGNTSRTPWIAPKGSVNDPSWTDNSRTWAIQQYEAYDDQGRPIPPPTRNVVEPPIQAFQAGMLMCDDQIRRAVGYNDTILTQSQADLSGVAIEKRMKQVSLSNMHFGDNLKRSQWHCGRVMLALTQELFDTPRVQRMLSADGTVTMQAITMAMEDGTVPSVAAFDGGQAIQIDVGKYDVAIGTGTSYASQLENRSEILLQTFRAMPETFLPMGDLFFEAIGQPALAERWRMMLPPTVQEGLAAKEQGLDPKAAALLMSSKQENAKLQQTIQMIVAEMEKLLKEKEAKIVDNRAKAEISREKNQSAERMNAMDNATRLQVEEEKHAATLGIASADAEMEAIASARKMLHELTVQESVAASQREAQGRQHDFDASQNAVKGTIQ